MAWYNRNRYTQQPEHALVAATQQIDTTKRDDGAKKRKNAQWQDDAWRNYDEIPELWFAHNFVANALRRIRIFPAIQPDPSEAPIPLVLGEDGDLATRAYLELDRLKGTDGSHGEIMHDLAMQLSIPGEGYLVGDIDIDTGLEQFNVVSTSELVRKEDGRWYLMDGPDDKDGAPLGEMALVNRIWRQHPKWRNQADSGMRSVGPLCEELQILSRWGRATARTRLNAGALFVPSELSLSPAEGQAMGLFGQNLDPFLDALLTAMITPIKEEGSASAVVPAVFKVKGDMIDKIKHLVFDRPFDKEADGKILALIRRIASGIDIPAEVVLGMADLNHWTAWQVDEQTFKAHLEPLVTLMVNGLTEAFLQPAMAEIAGNKVIVWFDPSALISNPNRVNSVKDAHEAIVISDEAARKYWGYTEEDAPSPEEKAEREARAAAAKPQPPGAAGGSDPATATEDANADPAAPADGEAAVTADGRFLVPTPSVNPAGVELARKLAQIDYKLRHELQAGLESILSRAIEGTGTRLRIRTHGHKVFAPLITNVPNRGVALVLGRQAVSSFLAIDELMNDALAPVVPLYNSKVAAAQAEVAELLADLSDELDTEEMQPEQEENRQAGLLLLMGSMSTLLAKELFNPTRPGAVGGPSVGVPSTPATSPVVVPPTIVRESLVVAGGGNGTAPGTFENGIPDGGVATGRTTESLLTIAGFLRQGWIWIYGDSVNSFQAHVDLDNVEFVDWFDDKLAVQAGDEWIGFDFYHPGDHNGCQCDAAPLFDTNDASSADTGE